MERHDRIWRKKTLFKCSTCYVKRYPPDGHTHTLPHLSAEADSELARVDMTSIRALAVSENLQINTGAGTLRDTTYIFKSLKYLKHINHSQT